MWRWARSRQGGVAVVGALVVTAVTVDSSRDVLTSPFRFVAALVIAAFLVWIVARWWEARTWPEPPSFARRAATSSGSRTLREDLNAGVFTDRGGFLFRPRHFFIATGLPPVELDAEVATLVLSTVGEAEPVPVAATETRTWWWFNGSFYWENARYSARDVHALIARRERRHEQELRRAHSLLAVEQAGVPRRESIPRDIRRAVFERDGGRCVECNATFDLQYDHVLPVALGGATSVENLQLLCGACNRDKSASI